MLLEDFDRLRNVKSFQNCSRLGLGVLALTLIAGAPSTAFAKGRGSERAEDQKGSRSGKGRFADGFFTGRFRRQGMYSSLTLGLASCMEGRSGTPCKSPKVVGEQIKTKSGFGFTKEIGYRIPWVFFGGSYTLGFLRPSFTPAISGLVKVKSMYQHSLLAVIRPTVPIWRVDLGFSISPGWSRQVIRGPEWSDKVYTQGFALGLGFVAALNITQKWLIGFRWDTIQNYHGKICAKTADVDKNCRDLDKDKEGGVNMGLSGLFLSHRW